MALCLCDGYSSQPLVFLLTLKRFFFFFRKEGGKCGRKATSLQRVRICFADFQIHNNYPYQLTLPVRLARSCYRNRRPHLPRSLIYHRFVFNELCRFACTRLINLACWLFRFKWKHCLFDAFQWWTSQFHWLAEQRFRIRNG